MMDEKYSHEADAAKAWAALETKGAELRRDAAQNLTWAVQAHLVSLKFAAQADALQIPPVRPDCASLHLEEGRDDCSVCEPWWDEIIATEEDALQCAHVARILWARAHGLDEYDNSPWEGEMHPGENFACGYEGEGDAAKGWTLVFGDQAVPAWMTGS